MTINKILLPFATSIAAVACSVAPTTTLQDARSADLSSPCSALVVLSSAGHLTALAKSPLLGLPPTKDFQTGFFLDEMAIPVQGLLDAGCKVTFANPDGNEPPRDPVGDQAIWFTDGVQLPTGDLVSDAQIVADLFGIAPTLAQQAELTSALALATAPDSPIRGRGPGSLDTPVRFADLDQAQLAQFTAVVIPGGHPPMVDLYQDADLGRILSYFHQHGKTTAAICHGPTALLAATTDGVWAYAGYRMTVVAHVEDQAANVIDGIFPLYDLAFYPDQALADAGAQLQETPFSSLIVEDRELLTGQQQFSAHAFRDRLLAKLGVAAAPTGR